MSTINPKIKQRAAQLAINSNPNYRSIRVDLDADGNLVYVDLVTQTKSVNDPSPIFNARTTLGLVDYRVFDPGVGRGSLADIGRTAGAMQLESEVMVVNQFLADAVTDPVKAQKLRDLGLGRMIGEEVTGELFKFNTRGQQAVTTAIRSMGIQAKAASSSLTDEGYTFLTLIGKNRDISAREGSLLRILSGAEQIQPKFLKKLLEDEKDGKSVANWFQIGKLAKRLQSTMSPRNVAVGEEFIRENLDRTALDRITNTTRLVRFEERALGIDSVAARIELMFRDPTKGIPMRESGGLALTADDVRFGDRVMGFAEIPDYQLTQNERVFISGGLTEGNRAQSLSDVERSTMSKAEGAQEILNRRLTVRANDELRKLKATYGFEDWEIQSMRNMFDEVNADLADPILENLKPIYGLKDEDIANLRNMTHAQKQFFLIKEKVKRLKGSGVDIDERLGHKISVAFEGMEKARDGQFYITPELLDNMISGFQSELDTSLNAIKAAGVPMTLEQTQNIKALQKQIEHLQKAKQKTGSGDIIARVNIGVGQFKGEAMVLSAEAAKRFRDPVTGLVPYVIGDMSAIKNEVGSAFARNVLFDIGEGGTEVFTDPLMMLYHGDYFTQPSMVATMRDNAMFGLNKTQEFMQNGVAPQEVMEAIRRDIAGDIKGIEEFMLDPQTRMSHLRKKREAEEIMAQMASGIKANEIPAMVRRVADYYSSQVVRYKDGRADVVMPTAGRFSLRTFESRIRYDDSMQGFSTVGINLSDYGLSGTSQIKTLNFQIKDHTLIMGGDAAYLYQHSLGGFDLDDKGIPLMSTYKDASGNKRLAFLGLRQPTSYQEYVGMSADLKDASTVHAIFENNQKFKNALQDDTVLATLGISRSDKTYQQLNQMVNGKSPARGIDREDIDENALEQMILRFVDSPDVFPGGLPSLTNQQVIRMAMLQSPSALGLDRLIRDKSGGLSPLGRFMTDLGLDPNKIPAPFDTEGIYQILQESSKKQLNDRVFALLSEELGYTVSSSAQALGILDGSGRPGDKERATYVVNKFVESIMSESLSSSAEESIGLFVNRQSSAVNVLEKSKQILLDELGMKNTDLAFRQFLERSSVLTIPASEAVDIAKQVGAEQVLYNFGAAVQMMQTQGLDASSANELLDAYIRTLKNPAFSPFGPGVTAGAVDAAQVPAKLGALGQMSLRGYSSVGYVRGKQIAQQIASGGVIKPEELYGLQGLLFDTGAGSEGAAGGYARIKNQDLVTVKGEIVSGLEAARDEATDDVVRNALDEQVNELKRLQAPEALTSLFMREGTVAYQKYADVEQMIREIMSIHNIAEATKRQALSAAEQGARMLSPTIRAQYKDPVANVVDTVSEKINQLKNLEQDFRSSQSESIAFSIKKLRSETLSTIHEGMSAVVEAERAAGRSTDGNSILDMMETLAASLDSRNFEASKLLQSPTLTGADGDPGIETMHNLFSAMRQRIIARSAQVRADVESVLRAQDMYASTGLDELKTKAESLMVGGVPALAGMSPLPSKMEDLTLAEAEAIIKASREIRKGKSKRNLTDAEQAVVQFAGRVKSYLKNGTIDDLRPGESTDAHNAFRYHIAGRKQLEDAARKASEAVTGFLTGTSVPAAATDAVSRSRDTARTYSAAKTVYKRFSESFKNGAVRDALENKGVRRGLIAAAALSVFGFVQSHRRDHSKDDVAGPPLLPGGSPYESAYPTRQAVIENLRTVNPVTRGMQYKVYTSGSSEDAEKLRSMAGGVTDGPVNSTMYSSLPLLGQNPYSQVASQF